MIQVSLETARALKLEIDALFLPPEETRKATGQRVIPFALVRGTRGYIEKVTHQINECYESTAYDGCAVLIRRLLETLIIESFEKHSIPDKIKDKEGNFYFLRGLVEAALAEDAAKPGAWNLSRNCRESLAKLKKAGDLSAHNRRYNAIRPDIDNLVGDLRVVVGEFVSIADLK